jgi:UDP-N-acetylglucosamine:LPS N-acetylglucosamine transferase
MCFLFKKQFFEKIFSANPKTKVFISPCGSNSVVDALDAGTPMLCIPVTTDQPYNAYLLAKKSLAQTILIPEIGQSANSQTNPLRIALEELLKWKDENQ